MLTRLIIGNQIIKLNAVNSTNTFALDLCKAGQALEGLVVQAVEQESGRGQYKTIWHSTPEQSLTISVILTPHFLSLSRQAFLNFAIALGIQDWAKTYCTDVKIKWPNDLYIADKKAGGILIENQIQGITWKYAVAGIGLNVFQTFFPENLPLATSIAQNGTPPPNLETALEHLLNCLDKRYLQLRNGHFNHLLENYHEVLWKYHTIRMFESRTEVFEAYVQGVNAQGQLILRRPDGTEQTFGLKEIIWL